MPSVSGIFQLELQHNEAGAPTNFVEEIQSDLLDGDWARIAGAFWNRVRFGL
jgi:hypothetical protein